MTLSKRQKEIAPRVIKDHKEGMGIAEIRYKYGVSAQVIEEIIKEHNQDKGAGSQSPLNN